MPMGYLVFKDRETHECLLAKRHALRTPEWSLIRQELQKKFPESTIYDPLTSAPKGCRMVTVYTSRNKEGIGRTGSSFATWSVGPALKQDRPHVVSPQLQQPDYLPRSPRSIAETVNNLVSTRMCNGDVTAATIVIAVALRDAFRAGMTLAAEIADKHTVPEAGQIAEAIRQEIPK